MENDFVSWLVNEMNQRGWNNSELARRSGVVHSTISLVLSRKSNPGNDLCIGLARAFKMPPEDVMRIAGLLPAVHPDDETLKAIYTYSKGLSSSAREQALDYIKYLYGKTE